MGWKKFIQIELPVLLFCTIVLCVGISRKEGYHMDELLSFELANAEFNPWIVPTQPEGRLAKFVHNEIDGGSFGETFGNLADTVKDVLKNRGESKLLAYTADVYEEPVWIDRQTFVDYITVGKDDAFNYLSVYFNVKDDNHPPLHFMLLHTVSSVFQGQTEAWMGCIINLAAVMAVMVLLMKLGNGLAGELGLGKYQRVAGILCAACYGLSSGALATVLLIRMYALLTLWCVAYFYLIIRKWQDWEFDKKNFRLILVTLLGFWTQYFFLFYCISLAAVTAVLLLRRRRLRELFCFVRSMITSAVVGIAAFPFAVSDVFSSGRGVEALENLSAGFAGYGARIWEFMKILASRTFFPLFWVMFVILAVEALWFSRKKQALNLEKNREKTALVWLLLLPVVGYFLLAARMSPYLVDRYVMPVFPFAILAGTLILFALLAIVAKRRNETGGRYLVEAVCMIALVLQLVGLYKYDGSYLYQGYGRQEHFAGSYADYPCICVYDGVGYYENLPEFTHYEKTLLLTYEELVNRQETESIRELDQVVVLVKNDLYASARVLDFLSERYGLTVELIGARVPGVHGDQLYFMTKEGNGL
ncbi:MAG: hypothetical protein J1E64_03690 [Acetatifactor sp.]|nr:hypothetical protein [Acetatifactor sp.]